MEDDAGGGSNNGDDADAAQIGNDLSTDDLQQEIRFQQVQEHRKMAVFRARGRRHGRSSSDEESERMRPYYDKCKEMRRQLRQRVSTTMWNG